MMLIHESTKVNSEAVPVRKTGFIADSSKVIALVAAPRVRGVGPETEVAVGGYRRLTAYGRV
jgi:hypothetical protein